MRKAQTLIIQFILFFLIGLAVFITVGNIFRIQLDVLITDVLTESLGLTNSYVNSVLIYSSVACKQCDLVNYTIQLPEKITHHYYKISLTNMGVNVSSLDRPEHFFSPHHNLNYTMDFSGEVFSVRPIFFIFNKTNYTLEVKQW